MARTLLALVLGLATATLGAADVNAPQELKLGLVGEYYSVGRQMDKMPDVKALKVDPVVRRIDKRIDFGRWENVLGDFADTNLDKYFAVVWTGVLRVPADGRYVLSLESDDGSRLFLDGKAIVDNDGVHGMREASGAADLKAGDHDLRIEFFQNDGLVGCRAKWETAGLDKQVIPATAFFHKPDRTLDR
jgi:hypothetical protein